MVLACGCRVLLLPAHVFSCCGLISGFFRSRLGNLFFRIRAGGGGRFCGYALFVFVLGCYVRHLNGFVFYCFGLIAGYIRSRRGNILYFIRAGAGVRS